MGDLSLKDVLDLGSGVGYYTRLALQLGAKEVVAVDISENMIGELPDKNVTGVVGDVAGVALERHFETIIIAGLIEFVDDPTLIFLNARKHAIQDASMVILAPRNNLLGRLYRLYHARHGLSISLFTDVTVLKLGAATGWELVAIKSIWPFSIVAKFQAVK